jgi:hypothetical protein
MIHVVHPGSRIRMLTFSHPGSRIPDPDPQHWLSHIHNSNPILVSFPPQHMGSFLCELAFLLVFSTFILFVLTFFPLLQVPVQALYANISLLEHSCINNASKHFDGDFRNYNQNRSLHTDPSKRLSLEFDRCKGFPSFLTY